jgi:hypothetical protein
MSRATKTTGTFSWSQREYRLSVVRWEGLAACFKAFLTMAMTLCGSQINSGINSWMPQGAALGRVAMQTKFARAGKAALS